MAANAGALPKQLRLEVEDIARAVNAQRKFRRPCHQLIVRHYGRNSRARTVTLRRVLGALHAIHSNAQARLISMAKLKGTMLMWMLYVLHLEQSCGIRHLYVWCMRKARAAVGWRDMRQREPPCKIVAQR